MRPRVWYIDSATMRSEGVGRVDVCGCGFGSGWWLRGQTFSGERWLLRASLVSSQEDCEGLDSASLWYWLAGAVGVAIARDGLGFF